MTTINACPFCGHDDVEIDEIGIGQYAVCCPECECIGPMKTEVMDAISVWNKAPQTIINRTLLASTKDLVKRITLDDGKLRETFAYEAHGQQYNFFDEHYRPKIDAVNAAIAEAETA